MGLGITSSLRIELLRQACASDLFSRSLDEIGRLATWLRRVRAADRGQDDLSASGKSLNIAVISSFLIDYLGEILGLMLLRRGFDADVINTVFGQLTLAVLNDSQSNRVVQCRWVEDDSPQNNQTRRMTKPKR